MKETYTDRFGNLVAVENGLETYTHDGDLILKSYRGNEVSVIVPEGVRHISVDAFANTSIENVWLPEGLIIIEHRAFRNCKNLKSIRIPDSTEYIMGEAFEDCSGLSNVIFPNTLKYLGQNAFRRTGIETAVFPAGIKNTLSAVYTGCERLTTAIIVEPEMVLNTGEFSKCDNLKNVYFDGPLTNLPPLIKYKIEKKKTIRIMALSEKNRGF